MNERNLTGTQSQVELLIEQVTEKLLAKFSWLNSAHLIAQRMTKKEGQKEVRYPAVFIGSKEYRNLLPSDIDQPYSFWLLHDPANYTPVAGTEPITSQPFSLIIWGDIRKIYTQDTRKNQTKLREDVVSFLNRELGSINGKIEIEESYMEAKNVFEDFDFSETKNQHLSYPFTGIRIRGTIKTRKAC